MMNLCFNFLVLLHWLSLLKKENILKFIASFFNPLGIISFVTTSVKTIFQLFCKDKPDWDDKISR